MKKLFLFIYVGLLGVTAGATGGHGDIGNGSLGSKIQKVSCTDKKTGFKVYELVREQVDSRVLYAVYTEYYGSEWDANSFISMMLTEERDNAIYFMSGLRPDADSLVVYKRTGEGKLRLDTGWGYGQEERILNCIAK